MERRSRHFDSSILRFFDSSILRFFDSSILRFFDFLFSRFRLHLSTSTPQTSFDRCMDVLSIDRKRFEDTAARFGGSRVFSVPTRVEKDPNVFPNHLFFLVLIRVTPIGTDEGPDENHTTLTGSFTIPTTQNPTKRPCLSFSPVQKSKNDQN